MRTLFLSLLLLAGHWLMAQGGRISGRLQSAGNEPLMFANVGLYAAGDSALVKAEISDDKGRFALQGIREGVYRLEATYVGLPPLVHPEVTVAEGQELDLGVLTFPEAAVELETALVKADRVMVEIKADRTVFNVQGTINSTGQDALALLRKAPGVLVDNNDNITVLGRTGVILYVDGKLMPLGGDERTQFLSNLQADQIDRIDIITNPGARYDAEGNAGIIDIRLKKDKNEGANGSLNSTYSQGRYYRSHTGGSANYRNKYFNAFGNASVFLHRGFQNIDFTGYQNGLFLDEVNFMRNKVQGGDYRGGVDYFVNDKQTIGFVVSGGRFDGARNMDNSVAIAPEATPSQPDSILVARTIGDDTRTRLTTNLNYRYDNRKGTTLNLDADMGRFRTDNERLQPNRYWDPTLSYVLTEATQAFVTPTDIDIYTLKADFEKDLWGGRLGIGAKASQVSSDNVFHVFDVVDGNRDLDLRRSNTFNYDERVYAGYVSFNRSLGKTVQVSAGLRAEQTDATGDLKAFLPELQEPPVELNYLSWFPSAGVSWQFVPRQSLSLNYGRRINRPDYQVLNPFNNQLSQLSFEKGNPFLRPEIVNNIELGYTFDQRYHIKLAYSRTSDQITRLIGPDESDPRANFISWENLAIQTVWNVNMSLPFEFGKRWNAFFNISASHLDNQANYGGDAIVDVQAFTYYIYQQHTFTLPYAFKLEVSGWYSGPGVWGGVFLYDPSWSLDVGIQRRFLQDKINVRLSAQDIFYEAYWSGVSEFNGLKSTGTGNWDSRRVSLSVTWDMGNRQLRSRQRSTGLEDEARRVGSGS